MKPLFAAALAALLATAAIAHDGIHVTDAYARTSANSGAIFLTIENHSAEEDRLLSVTTGAAQMAMLHTNVEDANGVMQMLEVEGGLPIPGHSTVALERGGAHVMLMGLAKPLAQGDSIAVTLTFARGEVIALDVPVDNDRKPEGHGAMDHSGHAGHSSP